jgi:mono/diheme cytochrome c family protein
MKILRLLLWLTAAGVISTAAAPAKKKAPSNAELQAELNKAPAEARSWQNPFAGQPQSVLAGRKLFKRHCAQCHGLDGAGKREEAPDLRSTAIQAAPPGVLFWKLKNGNRGGGMPSWSGLPDQQRWQIVTYVKSLGAADGPPPEDKPGREKSP